MIDTSNRIQSISRILVYLILLAGAGIVVFPLLWTIATSLKTTEQLHLSRLDLIPNPIAWENYVTVFQRTSLPQNLANTLIIVAFGEFGALVICSLVAYAFARIPFPGRNIMFMLLLSSMMLPSVVTLIPTFLIFDRLGWINTFLPLIVPRLLAHDPFYIFLMRQFFRGLPQDLSDAARIDGCSEVGIWWRIAMPISKPVLATVAIFTFQGIWGDFISPLVYLGGNRNLWTLALGLGNLVGLDRGEITIHYQMAFAMFMIVPMILIFAVGQRYFVQGITFSGLKG